MHYISVLHYLMKFNQTDSLIKRMVDTVGLPMYTFRRYAAKRNKKTQPVVGIPWYTKDNWYKMKALADDKDRFHESYDHWLATTDKSIVILTNRGKLFERLDVDPIQYAFWCSKNSIGKNKKTRTAYTQHLLAKKIKQT